MLRVQRDECKKIPGCEREISEEYDQNPTRALSDGESE